MTFQNSPSNPNAHKIQNKIWTWEVVHLLPREKKEITFIAAKGKKRSIWGLRKCNNTRATLCLPPVCFLFFCYSQKSAARLKIEPLKICGRPQTSIENLYLHIPYCFRIEELVPMTCLIVTRRSMPL